MRNFKRFAALTMASVMVLGSTVTAFAAENEGSLGGTGTSTGHLDTTVFSVQLPVVANTDTTFNYFADPEGHIAATGYSNTGIQISSNTDGVYFLNAGSETTNASVSSYSITVNGDAATSGLTITGLSDDSEAEGVYTYSDAGKWMQDEDELADTLVIKKVTSITASEDDQFTLADGELQACSFDGDTAVSTYSVVIDDPSNTPDGTYKYTNEDKWVGVDGDAEDVEPTINSITKTETITPAENDTITLVAYAAGGDAGYSSTSDALTVTNKSNVDVDITAAVTVTANDDNMTLAATKAALADAEEPTLYLGLKLGDTETAIESTGATKTVLVEGVDGYEEIYDSEEHAYAMAEKETHDDWETTTISLTGKVASTTVTEDVVAPAINVTWSYAKHVEAEEPEEPEITEPTASAESVAVGGSVNILLPEGVTITGVQKKKNDGSFGALSDSYYTLTDISGGKKLTVAENLLTTYAAATQIKVVFSSGDPITLAVTAQ